MNRTTVGSAAGAVLIGALLLRSPAPVPRAPAQTSRTAAESRAAEEARKAAKAKKEVAEDGPWKASRNYFGPARTDIEECSPASAGNDERNRLWCVPSETRVQAMIATVPDPVHTRLPLIFDRSI